jgi:hypothetical protein
LSGNLPHAEYSPRSWPREPAATHLFIDARRAQDLGVQRGASLDVNYFTGGRQTIGGNRLVDVQHNSRVGGMVVAPFRGRHAVKLGYFVGARTEFGADFDQFLASYQVVFR